MSFRGWTVSEVVDQLGGLGLGEYSRAFKENHISGEVLPLLTEDHMKEMGMQSIGHRLKLLLFIRELDSGMTTSKPSSKPTTYHNPHPVEDKSSDRSESATPSSRWDKKRRQLLLNRKQSSRPEMDLTPTETGGTFPDPPPVKRTAKNQRREESSDEDEEVTFNPNPFSREDSDLPAPKPRTVRKPKFAPKPAQRKPPSHPPSPPMDEDDEDDYQPLPRQSNPSPQPPAYSAHDEDDVDRVACSYCGRKFAADRLEKHEVICRTTSNKKRKQFDSSKMRIAGTGAEAFVGKTKEVPPATQYTKDGIPKFEADHQKILASIKMAKDNERYEKARAQGKVVEKPQRPAILDEDDDRVVCPNCGRKFAKETAERHIPICSKVSNRGGMNTRTRTRR